MRVNQILGLQAGKGATSTYNSNFWVNPLGKAQMLLQISWVQAGYKATSANNSNFFG
jgi:hypothetical protein